MNNFKRISAIILALCSAATIFASCNKDDTTDITTTTEEALITEIITEYITQKESVKVEVSDNKGEISVSLSEKIVTVPVTKAVAVTKNDNSVKNSNTTTKENGTIQIPSFIHHGTTASPAQNKTAASITDQPVKTTERTKVKTTVATTKKPVIDDKINEKSVGIFMMTKTDPVQIGNHATIFVQGTPGKTYSIEFYESPENVSKQSSLEDKKADENGFVTWTFEIGNSCNPGKRKLVVKEKNSSNYLETSITVK